jgi:hypothetical protein
MAVLLGAIKSKENDLDEKIFLALLKIYKSQGNSGKDLFRYTPFRLQKLLSKKAFDRLIKGDSSLGKIKLYSDKTGKYYALNIEDGDFYKRLKRLKKEPNNYVFSISEVIGISEKTGMPIFGKRKLETVKRVSLNAARNFIESKYSGQRTGKDYFIERER